MRIEPGQHAVDRRLDELAVIGLLHIVRPNPFEHIAEQAQLPVGIGGGRLCACPLEHDARLGCDQRYGHACRRTEENQGSFAHHHPRTSRRLRPTMALIVLVSRPDGVSRPYTCWFAPPALAMADSAPPPSTRRARPLPRTARHGYPFHLSNQDMIFVGRR